MTMSAGQVLIQLCHPPMPVPEPVTAMLWDDIATRTNMHTATSLAVPWPPSRQPLRHEFLAQQISRMGLPTTASRGAAIRQHIRDSPATRRRPQLPPDTMTRIAALAGTTYGRYAPGDRSQSPRPLPKRRTGDT